MKLSATTEYKEKIREIWCQYINRRLEPLANQIDEDPEHVEYKVLTLIEEQLLDVKQFLKETNLQIENIIAVTDRNPVVTNYCLFLAQQYGVSEKDAKKKYVNEGKVEDIVRKLNYKIDLFNLDYNGFYHHQTPLDSLVEEGYPLGLNVIFSQIKRFNKEVHFFLTNNMDDDKNLKNSTKIIKELSEFAGETIYLIPDEHKSVYQCLIGIVVSFSTIALEHGFLLKNIYPFLYRPENTYWMHMTIFHFDRIHRTRVSEFLFTGDRKIEAIKKNIEVVRSALSRVQILEK